ncbi:uncharacterized protein LOC130640919 [Hydractinia symbiolongicarpus]|uniref:uncharacterized protein LOC130640919 n=1 Tax=Hydractinia symbiolongicarpus TaxID=13093 RepID=UPI00254C5CC5|nr:uncharacterized protein LOC130640919 [Hydractinia symbiolongicarpus]
MYCILFMILFVTVLASNQSIDIVYWEIKPYIFRNENGDMDGLFPRIFKATENLCANGTRVFKYVKKLPDRNSFINLIKKNATKEQISAYGENELKNVTLQNSFWVPFYADNVILNSLLEKAPLMKFAFFTCRSLAVVMSQSKISLPAKILQGITSCRSLIIYSVLISIIFGIIIWASEMLYGGDFGKSFITGASQGVWWSFVTMTSVGYGDLVPRYVIGRTISGVWTLFGVAMICVMTATITDNISGTSSLDIYGKKVAVLSDSPEALIAKDDYEADIITADSLDAVFDLIRKDKADAALINIHVASWNQDDIRNHKQPLHVVYTINKPVSINALFGLSKTVTSLLNCSTFSGLDIFTEAENSIVRYCKTITIYRGSIKEFFKESIYMQILLGLTIFLVVAGCIYETIRITLFQKNVVSNAESKTDEEIYRNVLKTSFIEIRKLSKEIDYLKDDVASMRRALNC